MALSVELEGITKKQDNVQIGLMPLDGGSSQVRQQVGKQKLSLKFVSPSNTVGMIATI